MLTKEQIAQRIHANRTFMQGGVFGDDYVSDQDNKLPQPPLTKAPRDNAHTIPLSKDFDNVLLENDYRKLLEIRKSHRAYAETAMTLDQLAFLLWSTQGVTGIRGNHYAALRPVPSAGARHPYETYIAVRSVTGLAPGIYHYLPLTHALEFYGAVENQDQTVADSLCGQTWAGNAAVVFYYSCIPYRGEWRYSFGSHKAALLDAGHVVQNLYLSCEAIGFGACAIAAYEQAKADALLQLDGEEEFTVYAAAVGMKLEK